MTSSADKLLGIYLNDHWAGATAGLELARRAAGQNEDNDFGRELAEITTEIEEDREQLREVMGRLDVGINPVKQTAAWVGERLGRFKLNGQITGYSPLSRLVELEGLAIGVAGKAELWRSLKASLASDSRLEGIDLTRLLRRAEHQRDRLQQLHDRAAADALASASG